MLEFSEIREKVNLLVDKEIFFIVGAAKSGNTWLHKLLNGHPEICCVGESHFHMLIPHFNTFSQDYNKYTSYMNNILIQQEAGYPQLTNKDLQFLFVDTMALLLLNAVEDAHVRCIGEKTPDHIFIMDLLVEIWPKCKFIHIIRDGRDVAVSSWFQQTRLHPDSEKVKKGFAAYVDEVADDWVKRISTARSFAQKWQDIYFEIRYEDLHSSQDDMIKKLLIFLKVDASNMMVQLCREAGSFKKLSHGRECGEENKNSHFRKGIIGDWKNHFDEFSLEAFYGKGGKMIHELGY